MYYVYFLLQLEGVFAIPQGLSVNGGGTAIISVSSHTLGPLWACLRHGFRRILSTLLSARVQIYYAFASPRFIWLRIMVPFVSFIFKSNIDEDTFNIKFTFSLRITSMCLYLDSCLSRDLWFLRFGALTLACLVY